MPSLSISSTSFPRKAKWVKHLSLTIKICFSVFFVLTAENLFAQSFPTSCTSGDLTLLQASLPAPAGNRCNCDGARTLILGIRNGTNSFRTSFALWGTLVRTSSTGTTTASIFACASGVKGKNQAPPNGDNYLTASTIEINGVAVGINAQGQPVISVACGETLDITNMHLAWTSSNDNETCDVLKNSPSTINPKCGTQNIIHIGIGVEAAITTTPATCSLGGKIKVTPSGGIPPYEASLDGVNYFPVPVNTGYYEFSPVAAGQHPVTVRDNTGQAVAQRCSFSSTATVNSPAAVTAEAGANFTITCSSNPNGSTIGEASSTDFTYSWAPTDGLSSSTSSNPTANPSSTKTYTVTKTNIATGCSATDNVTVTVNKTAPTADAGSNVTVTCTTPGATLTATGGVSYLWSTTETTASIIVSPSSTTVYNVTVTGGNGCTATDNVTVTVNKTAPTADAGSNVTVTCTTPSATLTGTGGVSYLWSTNETTASINASPSSTTVYNVTVTGSNGCKASDNVTVTVNDAKPTFSVCLVQPDLCNQYGSVTVNASGTSLMYKLNNGSPTSNNVFSGLASGSVTSITVIGANGCSTTVNCASLVQDCEPPYSAAISRAVNIEAAAPETTVKAYPNPFNDRIKFVVSVPQPGYATLEVMNMLGQKVKTIFNGQVNAGNQSFEMVLPQSRYATLFYIFRMNGKQVSGKLIQRN